MWKWLRLQWLRWNMPLSIRTVKVELASLVHQKSRLVRGGARRAAFEEALMGRAGVRVEVVSARQRGRSGAGMGCEKGAGEVGEKSGAGVGWMERIGLSSVMLSTYLDAHTGSLGGGGGSGDSELQMQRCYY